MPKKTRSAARKAAPKRAAKRSAAAQPPSGAQDVTDDPANTLVEKIKLICDNDTNVHLFRLGGRLYLLDVDRAGVSGTTPA
jgi:hypothetical protein